MSQQPTTPECDRVIALCPQENAGEFLDWIIRTGHLGIYEYLGIDTRKVKEERRALLAWLREEQRSTPPTLNCPTKESDEPAHTSPR